MKRSYIEYLNTVVCCRMHYLRADAALAFDNMIMRLDEERCC